MEEEGEEEEEEEEEEQQRANSCLLPLCPVTVVSQTGNRRPILLIHLMHIALGADAW